MELKEAFQSANVERIRELMRDIKADEHLGNAFIGLLPLSYAAYIGNLAAAKVLLEKGADINQPSRLAGYANCYTPLWFAVYQNQIKMIEFLLSRNANPNKHSQIRTLSKSQPTPLFKAAFDSKLEATKLLLLSPLIDSTILNSENKSAKDLATNELIKKLIEQKFYKQQLQKLDEEVPKLELAAINEEINNRKTKITQMSTKTEQLLNEISDKMNEVEIFRMEIPVLEIELNALNIRKETLLTPKNNHHFEVEDSVIECPCCMEINLETAFFQCRHGHPFCDNCAGNLNVCPTCREPLDGERIRCLVLEKFLAEKQTSTQ